MRSLDGRVALITGASSGIGEATAIALASEGASVALVARRADRLEKLAGKIVAGGGAALVLAGDVTDESQAKQVVSSAVDYFGHLDTLINNAGVMLLGPIVDASTDEWLQMINVNLIAALHMAHTCLPHLLDAAENGEGKIADLVSVSSVAGRQARNGSGVYNATKHGLGAFSESLRQEVTRRHVRVSLVEPGAVDTELPTHNKPEIQEQMAKRFSEVERLRAIDIADAITYIVSRPRHVAINEMLIRPTQQEQ